MASMEASSSGTVEAEATRNDRLWKDWQRECTRLEHAVEKAQQEYTRLLSTASDYLTYVGKCRRELEYARVQLAKLEHNPANPVNGVDEVAPRVSSGALALQSILEVCRFEEATDALCEELGTTRDGMMDELRAYLAEYKFTVAESEGNLWDRTDGNGTLKIVCPTLDCEIWWVTFARKGGCVYAMVHGRCVHTLRYCVRDQVNEQARLECKFYVSAGIWERVGKRSGHVRVNDAATSAFVGTRDLADPHYRIRLLLASALPSINTSDGHTCIRTCVQGMAKVAKNAQ